MLDPWLALRLVKFIGLGLFAAGIWGSVGAARQRDRLTAALWVASAGWLASWIGGYGLMKLGQRSFEPWILQSMGATLVCNGGAILCAAKPRWSAVGAGLAVGGFAAAVGSMVSRGTATGPLVLAIPAALAIVATLASRATGRHGIPEDPDELRASAIRWFTWIARLEGASLILLVGIMMPVRKIWGVSIDGGTGTIGWVHGALVFLYLEALALAMVGAGWGFGRAVLGFVASLIPGGTIVFERRYLKPSASGPPSADVAM